MQSLGQLEKSVENLADEVNDIFHATGLNLEALGVQIESNGEGEQSRQLLQKCKKEFERLQTLYKERGRLRLEYLITQQIKEEEAKVRKERLVEYEEKIYDQRRLISDKEAFYEGLLKPRKKRPAHMTVQQFQSQRRQEAAMEERKNVRRLEEETYELKQISKVMVGENQHLQQTLKRLQSEEVSQEQLERILHALDRNPSMYDNLGKLASKRDDRAHIAATLQNISKIEDQTQGVYAQYREERELYQYLKWEHQKLKKEYQEANHSLDRQKRENYQKIKQIELEGRYRLRRAFSM